MWVVVTTVSEKYYRGGELLELIGLYSTMLMTAPIVFLLCAVGKCDSSSTTYSYRMRYETVPLR